MHRRLCIQRLSNVSNELMATSVVSNWHSFEIENIIFEITEKITSQMRISSKLRKFPIFPHWILIIHTEFMKNLKYRKLFNSFEIFSWICRCSTGLYSIYWYCRLYFAPLRNSANVQWNRHAYSNAIVYFGMTIWQKRSAMRYRII